MLTVIKVIGACLLGVFVVVIGLEAYKRIEAARLLKGENK